jgi:hypothetical protein
LSFKGTNAIFYSILTWLALVPHLIDDSTRENEEQVEVPLELGRKCHYHQWKLGTNLIENKEQMFRILDLGHPQIAGQMFCSSNFGRGMVLSRIAWERLRISTLRPIKTIQVTQMIA